MISAVKISNSSISENSRTILLSAVFFTTSTVLFTATGAVLYTSMVANEVLFNGSKSLIWYSMLSKYGSVSEEAQ
ncbi:hypothetical protein D3C80_2135940 [compost metagenome]